MEFGVKVFAVAPEWAFFFVCSLLSEGRSFEIPAGLCPSCRLSVIKVLGDRLRDPCARRSVYSEYAWAGNQFVFCLGLHLSHSRRARGGGARGIPQRRGLDGGYLQLALNNRRVSRHRRVTLTGTGKIDKTPPVILFWILYPYGLR